MSSRGELWSLEAVLQRDFGLYTLSVWAVCDLQHGGEVAT